MVYKLPETAGKYIVNRQQDEKKLNLDRYALAKATKCHSNTVFTAIR